MDNQSFTNEMQSHFLALYCMVVADGVIDVQELETLYRIGNEQYGLTKEQINQAIVSNGSSFIVPESIEAKIQFLFNLATIAWADGVLEDTEKELMHKYVLRLGFKKENIDLISNFIFDSVKTGKSIEETITLAKSSN